MDLRPIDSIKHQIIVAAGMSGTNVAHDIAQAVDSPTTSVQAGVKKGSTIKAIWLSVDTCGLAGSGTLNNAAFYIIKNPGNNLTIPDAFAWGTSNEKKFIFKSWHAMIMRNQDGNPGYHWEGWIKIPKRYQRMGTDDKIQIGQRCSAAVTGHFSFQAIFKDYS